jgi:uncharacterized protein (DUF1330 family)
MTAYWLARARVDEPEQYARYATQVPGILERHGARILARGGAHEVLEGPADFTRYVVIEFPNREAARDCFNSAEYQAAAAFRRDGGGVVEITIVDGI